MIHTQNNCRVMFLSVTPSGVQEGQMILPIGPLVTFKTNSKENFAFFCFYHVYVVWRTYIGCPIIGKINVS